LFLFYVHKTNTFSTLYLENNKEINVNNIAMWLMVVRLYGFFAWLTLQHKVSKNPFIFKIHTIQQNVVKPGILSVLQKKYYGNKQCSTNNHPSVWLQSMLMQLLFDYISLPLVWFENRSEILKYQCQSITRTTERQIFLYFLHCGWILQKKIQIIYWKLL
jgi:hypothetical protein